MSEIEITALNGLVLTNISDYTRLAPFMWVEGLKPSIDEKYSVDYPPQLVQTDVSSKIISGKRPRGSIETFSKRNFWKMPPSIEHNLALVNASTNPGIFRRKARIPNGMRPREKSEVPIQSGLKSKSVQARLAERQRRIVEDYYIRQSASSALSDEMMIESDVSQIDKGDDDVY